MKQLDWHRLTMLRERGGEDTHRAPATAQGDPRTPYGIQR